MDSTHDDRRRRHARREDLLNLFACGIDPQALIASAYLIEAAAFDGDDRAGPSRKTAPAAPLLLTWRLTCRTLVDRMRAAIFRGRYGDGQAGVRGISL